MFRGAARAALVREDRSEEHRRWVAAAAFGLIGEVGPTLGQRVLGPGSRRGQVMIGPRLFQIQTGTAAGLWFVVGFQLLPPSADSPPAKAA